MINKEVYHNFWKALQKNDNYLITTHINPDGDGICSIILFGSILSFLKKKYYMVIEGSFPEKLKFLYNEYKNVLIPELIQVPKGQDICIHIPETFTPESVLILDTCGNNGRLGEFTKYFSKINTVFNIDHHTGTRKFPGKIDLVDEKASATGEIIYELLKYNKYKIDSKTAKLIYISIITDTRNFMQSNTTAITHNIVSHLLETGIQPEKIHFYFQELQKKTLQIYGKVISRLQTVYNDKLVYSHITNKELSECLNSDVDGLIEILRNVQGTQAALLLKEIGTKEIKCSMRGKNGFNVFNIAKKYKGGGHKQAAGFTIEKNLKETTSFLLKHLKEYF